MGGGGEGSEGKNGKMNCINISKRVQAHAAVPRTSCLQCPKFLPSEVQAGLAASHTALLASMLQKKRRVAHALTQVGTLQRVSG